MTAPIDTPDALDANTSAASDTASAEPTAADYAALEQESTDTDADAEDQGDRRKSEGGKYRARLREAETERDALRDQLGALHDGLVNDALAAAGLDRRLFDAAGNTVADFIADDGRIDSAKLKGAIDSARAEFKVATGFAPNRAQGMGGTPPPTKPSLSDAFRRR
jgi:hypothetical protein